MVNRSRTEQDAFVVSRCVDGSDTRIPCATPASAAALVHSWLRRNPEVSVSWVVDPDWPDPVVVAARRHTHLPIGLDQKCTHLFVVNPGEQVGPRLISRCGKSFAWWELEFATDLDTAMGAGCVGCVAMSGAGNLPELPLMPSTSCGESWNGWDTYYLGLGWDVVEHDGRLLLAGEQHDVVAVRIPIGLVQQVQDDLAEREMQAPLLFLPSMPDEALFVVTRTPVPVPMPPDVHRVPAAIPLPPSPADEGAEELVWALSPGDVIPGRCRDLDVVAAVYKLRPPVRPEVSPPGPRRTLTR